MENMGIELMNLGVGIFIVLALWHIRNAIRDLGKK